MLKVNLASCLFVLGLCIDSGLAIKCVVNGDYERKNNPKQTKSSVMECPNGVTHCITVSGKIAEDRGLKPFRFCGDRGGNENKCSNEDGGTICYCDTDLCNSEPIKCIVNGDYERKNNPKQTEPFAKECPIGVTHCITVSGKIAEDRGLKPFRFCGDRGGNENKCSNEDGGKICYCDTNLCNADTSDSLAVRFLLNWITTLMAFGLFLVLTIIS